MERTEKSGLLYPSKLARVYLEAMEELAGPNGLTAAFRTAGLAELTNDYPPCNLDTAFDSLAFSTVNGALDEIYGPGGGRALALREGRESFAPGRKGFGPPAGVGGAAVGAY